jgi:hypothetical protein
LRVTQGRWSHLSLHHSIIRTMIPVCLGTAERIRLQKQQHVLEDLLTKRRDTVIQAGGDAHSANTLLVAKAVQQQKVSS